MGTTTLRRSADRKVTNLPSPNGKTAKIANSFGLPAGKAFSCPGATSVCEEVCYAGKLEKIYSGVRNVLTANYAALQAAGTQVGMALLLQEMINDFRAECERVEKKTGTAVERVFRIHWDGDFFSTAYAAAWGDVIRNTQDVHFWVYTRSFHTDGGSVDVLPLLAGLPNLSLYLSVDRANVTQAVGARKRNPWVLWAWLAETFADGMAEMPATDGKRFPCPENGGRIPLITQKGSACVRCGVCVAGRGDVVFSIRKR